VDDSTLLFAQIQDLRANSKTKQNPLRSPAKRASYTAPSLNAILLWQTPEVIEWLRLSDLDDFCTQFARAGVNGDQLLNLSATSLVAMSITVCSVVWLTATHGSSSTIHF
jgi:hypothetical protein